MLFLVGGEEIPPVLRRGRLLLDVHRFGEGRQGVNRKLSIIGVLLFKIVFGLYFWITVLEDLE